MLANAGGIVYAAVHEVRYINLCMEIATALLDYACVFRGERRASDQNESSKALPNPTTHVRNQYISPP
jgi:hypothetical protein